MSKVKAVMEAAIPLTKKEGRSFLGLAGYYHRFILQLSQITVPLMDLVKKPKRKGLNKTEECQIAFDALKKACSTELLL